jgi:hypothetical protein
MNGTLQNISVSRDVRRYAGATGHDLHIDGPLSNLTIGYRPDGLIADQIYPSVPVQKESDIYYVWDKATMLRVNNAQRARGTAANEIHFSVSSAGYQVKNYAFAVPLPLEDIANADAALRLRDSAAFFATDQLGLAYEDRVAQLLINTSNMGSSTTLTGDGWKDHTGSNPIEDFYAGRDSIRSTTGKLPNTWIFSDRAYTRFCRHPEVINFIRGTGDNTGGGPVKDTQIAAAFGVDRVLVGRGIKALGDEDTPATYTDIWSTAAILLYVAPRPDIMTPSHGYTFTWNPAGFPGNMAVERYVITDRKVEKVEVHQFQDEKVVASELGYLIVGC